MQRIDDKERPRGISTKIALGILLASLVSSTAILARRIDFIKTEQHKYIKDCRFPWDKPGMDLYLDKNTLGSNPLGTNLMVSEIIGEAQAEAAPHMSLYRHAGNNRDGYTRISTGDGRKITTLRIREFDGRVPQSIRFESVTRNPAMTREETLRLSCT